MMVSMASGPRLRVPPPRAPTRPRWRRGGLGGAPHARPARRAGESAEQQATCAHSAGLLGSPAGNRIPLSVFHYDSARGKIFPPAALGALGPGAARRPHRRLESPLPASAAGRGLGGAGCDPGDGHPPRAGPRFLQGDQRRLRPSGRRPRPAEGDPPAAHRLSCRRPADPLRRRRVRRRPVRRRRRRGARSGRARPLRPLHGRDHLAGER